MVNQQERAEADVTTYCKAMMEPEGWRACLAIERRWGLDGYTPQIVTTILDLVSKGADPADAETKALGQDDEREEGE